MAANANHLAALSRLFSSAVFRQMAAKGRSGLFTRLASEAGLFARAKFADRVRDTFDLAFGLLKRNGQRDEYVYKAALVQRILMGRHNLNTACMLSEFRAGASKADVAILNGTTTVYEIKSERDSLTRLARQIDNYRTVFSSVVVIAGENHVDAVLRSTARDVGVMSLSSRYQIATLREPESQPWRISPLAVLEAVRTDEAKAILAFLGLAPPRECFQKSVMAILASSPSSRRRQRRSAALRQASRFRIILAGTAVSGRAASRQAIAHLRARTACGRARK